MKKTLILLLWSTVGWGESRLEQLLQRQREAYPPAVITGGFYDPRGISRYRSVPGMHSGYDIAMPAGAVARAAWPGRVRSVIPWAAGEWGVEVEHSDGTSATYGHVVPLVTVGQEIRVGEGVGSIARDHLDVKMRDAQGVLFDYGSAQAVALGRSLPARVGPSAPALELQRRLRSLRPGTKSMDPAGWARLNAAGLRVGSRPSPELLPELERAVSRLSPWDLKRLEWEPEDQARARASRAYLKSIRYRYDLGFVSLRQLKEAERFARIWSIVEK